MNARLASITIKDFRSIRGEVTIPLDAPVVLIHGQNGAGKTSILSAIELGLTGAVATLGRGDPDYVRHLAHKSSTDSRISLTVRDLQGESDTNEVAVAQTGLSGAPLLVESQRRFFTERCYLAQSTLGRLLELYQYQDTRKSDSALTRFVKDLLGLDQLEALIEGLHPAADIRRMRVAAPIYWAGREDLPVKEKAVETLRTEQTQLSQSLSDIREQVRIVATALDPKRVDDLNDPEDAARFFSESSEDASLQAVARQRRDLVAMAEQWRALARLPATLERDATERAAREAEVALHAWSASDGALLEKVLLEIQPAFPDVTSKFAVDPSAACSSALLILENELKRFNELLTREAVDAEKRATIEQNTKGFAAKIEVIDTQIGQVSGVTQGYAQALAELLPHIHSDDCPVCGRDYSQVSKLSLRQHLLDRLTTLTEQAARLNSLSKEKSQTLGAVAAAERDLVEIRNRQLEPTRRDEIKTRKARYEELRTTLQGLATAAARGTTLRRDSADSARRAGEAGGRDQRTSVLRADLAKLEIALGQAAPDSSESVDVLITRLTDLLESRERVFNERQRHRRQGSEQAKAWTSLNSRQRELTMKIADLSKGVEALRLAKNEADRRLEVAKDLGRRAREVRASIVRQVFNDKLNRVWRELFIRLAPEEPFVPAFALPDAAGNRVEAVLETLYRAGGKGGNPGAMLSAGNLNTAALTLFLSLHLSVDPMLPWLIIDDPVQSMDEVHIAQFAALLRTLSKQQNRQVIVAVHERSLFDYLALELSPAFPEDRLITLGLGKNAEGQTTVDYQPKIFVRDVAFAA